MTVPPADEWQTKALANFPFEIVEASGENALARWEELKIAGRGVPVVVGDLRGALEPFSPDQYATQRPVQETLAIADALRFPEGLSKARLEEIADATETLRKLGAPPNIEDEQHEPPLGEW